MFIRIKLFQSTFRQDTKSVLYYRHVPSYSFVLEERFEVLEYYVPEQPMQ
jgi:hypothetical protein